MQIQRSTIALASLSYAEQDLYYLHCYREVSIKQLADLYSLTNRAIRMRLRRIDSKLEQANLLQVPA